MIALSSFVRFHATRSPDRPALAYVGERVSYAELMRRIESAIISRRNPARPNCHTAAWRARYCSIRRAL